MTHLQKALQRVNLARILRMDFEQVCPYSIDELSEKNRKPELVAWRHVSMMYDTVLLGCTLKAGKAHKLHHSTVLHGLNRIAGHDKTDTLLIAILDKLKATINGNQELNCQTDLNDKCQLEAIGLLMMENYRR